MKIVIAVDSFKGSLSSIEAERAAEEGIKAAMPGAETVLMPLADGGEGTVEAFVLGAGAKEIHLTVTGPLGKPVACTYGILEEERTAVIEVAAAAGLTLTPEKERNPLNTTSYGVGEIIRDAIEKGCRRFIVGMGGSATNDGGLGMLNALGFHFKNIHGESAGIYGRDLASVEQVNTSQAAPELSQCEFIVACDVNNPLCGANGASMVFGPQKGAGKEMAEQLDQSLRHFSEITRKALQKDMAQMPGAGAAGGLGYGFMTYLNGKMENGIDLVLKAVQMETELSDADIVVTGEGRMDFQTAMGKAPVGVARLAKKYGCMVLAFTGAAAPEAGTCNGKGIDAYFPIVRGPIGLREAMEKETAYANLRDAAKQVFSLVAKLQAARASLLNSSIK